MYVPFQHGDPRCALHICIHFHIRVFHQFMIKNNILASYIAGTQVTCLFFHHVRYGCAFARGMSLFHEIRMHIGHKKKDFAAEPATCQIQTH